MPSSTSPLEGRADYVLGIDFGGTKIALGAATRGGEPIAVERLPTEPERGAASAVERAIDAARELIARTGRGGLLAVGAVSPGVVGAEAIRLAPNVPGWSELALARALSDGLDVGRVAVGNDVKAAAHAEARWGALRGADPGVLLSLGTGVAVGIVIGGRVLEGANGAAGEIGYFVWPGAGPGAASDRAPLEEQIGGRALGERGARLIGARTTAADLFASDDAGARALVDGALDDLALHVANVATLIDPRRIAVGGGLMGSRERVLGALRERLQEATPFPPELVAAQFAGDGPLRGAIALALDGINQRRD